MKLARTDDLKGGQPEGKHRRSLTTGNTTLATCRLIEKSRRPSDNPFFYRFAYEAGSESELDLLLQDDRQNVLSDRPKTTDLNSFFGNKTI